MADLATINADIDALDAENDTQAAKIAEALSLLNTKAAGSGGGDEVWELVGDVTIEDESQNINIIAVTATKKYRKYRMIGYVAGTKGTTAFPFFDNHNASAYTISPQLSAAYSSFDFIVEKDLEDGTLVSWGTFGKNSWDEFFGNARSRGQGQSGNVGFSYKSRSEVVLNDFDKTPKDIKLWKYDDTFKNGTRFAVWGCL